MCQRLILAMLLTVSIIGCANTPKASHSGKETLSQHHALMLNCTITAQDFSGLKDTAISKETVISGMKHEPGGAVKIATLAPYEFWVMVHGTVLSKPSRILNYQVAIKDKRTNQFFHALSETSPDSAHPPRSARISLVEYHPNSMMEKGELFLECK